MIKPVMNCLIHPLLMLYNKCPDEGVGPDQLKISKLLLRFKKENVDDFSNYRSTGIVLFSYHCKISEIILKQNLMFFLNNQNKISRAQFGLRAKNIQFK